MMCIADQPIRALGIHAGSHSLDISGVAVSHHAGTDLAYSNPDLACPYPHVVHASIANNALARSGQIAFTWLQRPGPRPSTFVGTRNTIIGASIKEEAKLWVLAGVKFLGNLDS